MNIIENDKLTAEHVRMLQEIIDNDGRVRRPGTLMVEREQIFANDVDTSSFSKSLRRIAARERRKQHERKQRKHNRKQCKPQPAYTGMMDRYNA